jgi:hypothetical protein
MKISRLAIGSFAILISSISACTYIPYVAQQTDNGTLFLINGNRECPISLNENRTVGKGSKWYSNISECDFNGVSAIRLENFNSAIELQFESFRKLSLHDDPENRCFHQDGAYTFTTKTSRAMTNATFTISRAMVTEPGQPITAGVRLISKNSGPYWGNSDLTTATNFACVHIKPSD